MKLEWNENKRNETLNERGLDFADVAHVDWNNALTAEDTQHAYSETDMLPSPKFGIGCVSLPGATVEKISG